MEMCSVLQALFATDLFLNTNSCIFGAQHDNISTSKYLHSLEYCKWRNYTPDQTYFANLYNSTGAYVDIQGHVCKLC